MQIVVVNYDELNSNLTQQRVIRDIVSFFTQADTDTKAKLGTSLRMQLSDLTITKDAEVTFVDTSIQANRQLIPDILKQMKIDLLVSYNLAGFEWSTLTDGLGYNLIDCRQIHFITDENLPNAKYLNKIMSINLFITNLCNM